MDFFTKNKQALEKYSFMSKSIGIRADYVQGGGGNTSVKLNDRLMAIKASGYCLKDVCPNAAYAVMDYKELRDFYCGSEPESFEDVEKAGSEKARASVKTIEGLARLRPSVEAGFHSLLNSFVIHSHSVYTNLAACTEQCREIAARALKGADYIWGFVHYTDPGVRLTFSIRDELRRVEKEYGKIPEVIFMENHGLIVHSGDPERALSVHADANRRIAAEFGLSDTAFPDISLKNVEGMMEPAAPYLAQRFKNCGLTDKDMIEDALYPDQMVFLSGQFHMEAAETMPDEGCCTVSTDTGRVRFNMSERKARVMAETLSAVMFIRENIERAGLSLSTMGEAARAFIANWEGEKYRKSLAGGK